MATQIELQGDVQGTLLRRFRRTTRVVFEASLQEIEDTLADKAPRDTGGLGAGMTVTPAEPFARGWSARVYSLARGNDGRDYGSILERGTGGMTIRPTRANALHWIDSSGNEFFRASVQGTDIHKGWFTDILDNDWPGILKRNMREIS